MWELTTFAEKNIESKEELAKFFYYWIGSNIEYDYETLQKMVNDTISNEEFWKTQDEYVVYNNRKGVCAGYAKLYKWFLDWVDIETVIISGHIRDERNQYIELDIDDNYRHAWNAIKLNEKWKLIDTTWGASNDDSQSEFYYDIKPQLLINTHYPKNSKWQLLKKPLSLEEFNNSKFVKLTWFFSGFSDIPKLKKDNYYYYFMYKTNSTNKNLSVKLEISNDNLNFKPIKNTLAIDQDGITYVRFEKNGIPKNAFYKVNLYEFDYPYYLNIINFKTE